MAAAILYDRRIILLGKTGNGKSSTGNSLLGRQAFHNERRLRAVTQTCDVHSCTNNAQSKRYVIMDTPGLMDREEKLAVKALEIQNSVRICPKPHAFLLVFSSTCRITKDEEFTIDMLRVIFGEKVFEQCIVVFTNGDKFRSAEEFNQFLGGSDMMVNLVNRCGGRIARIENHSSVDSDSNEDAQHILAMVESMSGSGQNMYEYPWLSAHTRALNEHLANYNGQTDFHRELSALAQRLGKSLNRSIWTQRLVGGVLIVAGVGVAGAAGAVGAVAGSSLAATTTGAVVISNTARIGSTIVGTAWAIATRFRFW